MSLEQLNISIIYGTGRSLSPLPELLNNLPQVSVSEQTCEVPDFLNQSQRKTPDSVVVSLDDMTAMPEWIEEVSRKFPQTPVLVCSENMEMDFLMRALQLGITELLPSPPSQAEMEEAIKRVRLTRQQLHGTA